jgi:hypothetical protein
MSEDRVLVKVFDTAVNSPGIQLVDIAAPSRSDWWQSTFPAGIAAFLSFSAGSGIAQFIIDREWLGMAGATKAYASLALGGTLATIIFVVVYLFTVTNGSTRFFVEWNNKSTPSADPPDGFIETARNNERKRLTGRMRTLLQTLAQHYDEINTLAVGAWYESKYLNRSQIEDVRPYMVLIGAATETERGGRLFVDLSQWGRLQLAKWKVGDFGDVIELAPNSPTPAGTQ